MLCWVAAMRCATRVERCKPGRQAGTQSAWRAPSSAACLPACLPPPAPLPHLTSSALRRAMLHRCTALLCPAECDNWCDYPVADRPNAVRQFMEAAKADPSMIKVGPPARLAACLPARLAGWLAGAIDASYHLSCPFTVTAYVSLALLTALHHPLYCTA